MMMKRSVFSGLFSSSHVIRVTIAHVMYSGGSSAVVSDGVIQFNLNGCVALKCKGQTTEDGALNFMDLQDAGFQIQAANGQSAPSQRKTIQIAENITSETVTMTQE